MMLYVQDFDTSGLIRVTPNALVPGQFQDMYLAIMGDTLHKFELQKTWTDPQVEMQHYRYQETYRNLRVEAAEYTEHASDGYLVFSNFKVSTFDLDQLSEPNVTEEDALSTVIESLTDHEFAWSDSDWEKDLQDDLGDPTATYYPEGELMYALIDFHIGNWYISPSKYRLAWRFDVLSLEPSIHKAFYVDAVTGVIIREEQLRCTNGPANIPNHGTQTIDTREKGSIFILKTDDNDRRIHTKYDVAPKTNWSSLEEIEDTDDNWGNAEQEGTQTHWMATQAWDFFASSPYNREGSNGSGKRLRIRASSFETGGAFFDPNESNWWRDVLVFADIDGNYSAVIDVVGHEFTHAVTKHTAELIYQDESGALNESFSDIFGFMVERFAEGGVSDWELGEDGGFSAFTTRSMENPDSSGSHLEPVPLTSPIVETEVLGQPETYGGTFWYNGLNDFGGVHINSGVQNYWFHLLADGGTGTNDNGDAYNIQGIGIDGAALVSYWNLTNILSSGSQYIDARTGAIMAAEIFWGPCSNFSIQTTNAWAAVGVGAQSTCAVTDLEMAADLTPILFPNPTTDQVTLTFHDARPRSIQVYSVTGSLIEDVDISSVDKFQFSTANLANGAYLVQVLEGNRIFTLKLIKI